MIVTNQDYFLTAVESIIEISEFTYSKTMLSKTPFLLNDCFVKMSNTQLSHLSSQSSAIVIMNVLNTVLEISNVTYTDSTVKLMSVTLSTLNAYQLTVSEIESDTEVIYLRSLQEHGVNAQGNTVKSEVTNSVFSSIVTHLSSSWVIVSSHISSFSNVTLSGFSQPPLEIQSSKIATITNLNLTENDFPVEIIRSEISSISNSSFTK